MSSPTSKRSEPPYQSLRQLSRLDRWLNEFRGVYYQPAARDKRSESTLASPDYSSVDLLRLVAGNVFSLHSLYFDEVQSIDLEAQVPRIEVPTFFLQGRHDHNTPGDLVEGYFRSLEAPRGKALVWFEESAHVPELEQPAEFQRALIENVLPVALASQHE